MLVVTVGSVGAASAAVDDVLAVLALGVFLALLLRRVAVEIAAVFRLHRLAVLVGAVGRRVTILVALAAYSTEQRDRTGANHSLTVGRVGAARIGVGNVLAVLALRGIVHALLLGQVAVQGAAVGRIFAVLGVVGIGVALLMRRTTYTPVE